MGTVGIPVKLLHEAVGHTITIELKGGVTYRGRLFDAEDNFKISMKISPSPHAMASRRTWIVCIFAVIWYDSWSSQICCNRLRCSSVSVRMR